MAHPGIGPLTGLALVHTLGPMENGITSSANRNFNVFFPSSLPL